MITEIDRQFLKRAMRLAMNGRGHTEPNPSVGCVLVKSGQTIGEGWTQAFGGAHAEPTALADCKSRGNDPTGATAYVTLEPCCHTNKKTPPCAPRLIEAKIARVVIGCLDPNPDVNGNGVAMLREAGVEVSVLPGVKPSGSLAPVLGGEGQGEGESAGKVQDAQRPQVTTPSLQPSPPSTGERELNVSHFQQLIAPFILRQTQKRPYVTLKWAETADGYVAGAIGRRIAISNPASNRFVHQLRSRSGGIVVGINTVLKDDPSLTVRGVENLQNEDIYILDSAARTPLTAKVLESGWATVVTANASILPPASERVLALTRATSRTTNLPLPDPTGGDRVRLQAFFEPELHRHSHFLVEPGPTLARSFFDDGFCDRLVVIRSAKSIKQLESGDVSAAPRSADIPSHFLPVGTLDLAGDILTEYLNTQSPAFFAPVPSADFVLAQEEVGHGATPGST